MRQTAIDKGDALKAQLKNLATWFEFSSSLQLIADLQLIESLAPN
jgi:hypothetical protein